MRKLLLYLANLALFFVGFAPGAAADGFWSRTVKGSGDLVKETREVDSFSRIKNSGACDIFVTVGGDQRVEVEFDDNLIDMIETRVRGKTLYVESDGSWSSKRSCKITISIPTLESIRVSGSGDIVVTDLDTEFFEYSVSGSGDLRASGKVKEFEVSVSGSGDVDARELVAQEAIVSIRGSGDVTVYASESFDGSISGSGDIRYYGDPKHTSSSIAGSGSIKKR